MHAQSSNQNFRNKEYNPNENIFKKQLPVVFYKKIILKHFAKFIGKHLRQSFFLNKVARGLQLY